MGAQGGGDVVTLRDVELHDWAREVVEVIAANWLLSSLASSSCAANGRASSFSTALDTVTSASAAAAEVSMSTSMDSCLTADGLLTLDSAI